ncbi:MAG: hypothetical protein ACRDRG_12215 [Pseudonocardiaceae bacterium]
MTKGAGLGRTGAGWIAARSDRLELLTTPVPRRRMIVGVTINATIGAVASIRPLE